MKLKKYIFAITILSAFMFGAQSCFQDLDDDPPFNYPQEPENPEPNTENLIFYMPFEDNYKDMESEKEGTKVGAPTFSAGLIGKAYSGAADSYVTYKTADFKTALGEEFTLSFWYNINTDPDRAGIIVIGPETTGAPAEAQNNRTAGFRLFREGSATAPIVKGNIGIGDGDVWVDGGDNAKIAFGWVHVALVVMKEKAVLYFNAEEVKSVDLAKPISWNGCDIMSVGSGAPRFTEWNHLADKSKIDELRIFNKALSGTELNEWITYETKAK